jgi:glycosyltransferase involved in cell wall biosynthesis
MASSVPVVATDVGGVSDLLGLPIQTFARDGFVVCQRGVLCEENNASGFAKGLRYLIDIDSNIKQQHLNTARNFVKEKFSETRLVRDIESIYLELMKERRRTVL